MSDLVTPLTHPTASSGASERLAPGVLSRATFVAAASLSLVAAGIHLWATPAHLAAWWGYGAFFMAAATAQTAFVWALALHPGPRVLRAGIWGTVAVLVLYLVTRTAGVPFGPDTGMVEHVGALDAAAAIAQVALLIVLCAALRGRAGDRSAQALLLVGLALWASAMTGVLSPGAFAGAAGLKTGQETSAGATGHAASSHRGGHAADEATALP